MTALLVQRQIRTSGLGTDLKLASPTYISILFTAERKRRAEGGRLLAAAANSRPKKYNQKVESTEAAIPEPLSSG